MALLTGHNEKGQAKLLWKHGAGSAILVAADAGWAHHHLRKKLLLVVAMWELTPPFADDLYIHTHSHLVAYFTSVCLCLDVYVGVGVGVLDGPHRPPIRVWYMKMSLWCQSSKHLVLIKGSGFECTCAPWTFVIVVQCFGFWWTWVLSPTDVSEESRWNSAVVLSRKVFQQSHFNWFSTCVFFCVHEADMFVLPATVDTAQLKQLFFLSFILPRTILKIFLCSCVDEEDILLPTTIRCSSAYEATPAHPP